MKATDLASGAIAGVLTAWTVHDLSAGEAAEGGRSLRTAVTSAAVINWISISSVHDRLEEELGPGWATVALHSLTIIAAGSVLDLQDATRKRPLRGRLTKAAVTASTVAVSVAPWLLDPPRATPVAVRGHLHFYDHGWQSTSHHAVVLAYLLGACVKSIRSSAQIARQSGPGRTRTGLQLIATGTAVGMPAMAVTGVVQAAWLAHRGEHLVAPSEVLRKTCGIVGMTLIGLGVSWARLGAAWDGAAAGARARVLRRRVATLHPHWQHLVSHAPEVSPFPNMLQVPGTSVQNLDFQQMRMALEIYDAARRLGSYLSEEDQELVRKKVDAAGLRGRVAQAVIERALVEIGSRRSVHGSAAHDVIREPVMNASTYAAAAKHIAADLRRLRRRRARAVIDAILDEEQP